MVRCGVLLVVLGACGFQGSGRQTAQPDDAAPAIDAPTGVMTDAATKDAAPAMFCDPNDDKLVACYEFENDTLDRSSNQLDAQMTGVSYGGGKFGQALVVDDNSAGDTTDKPVLNLIALTIEAWINPSQLPDESNKAYVLDVNNQYALYIDHNGDLFCTLIGGPSLSTMSTGIWVSTGGWTHVACTFDGITQAVIYVNGAVAKTNPGNGALGTGGTTGLSIGGNNPSSSGNGRFNGSIDQLRLMKVARTTAQICSDSGKTLRR
ncbi:MAG: LamG domain-containing protein [Deltaproteobacteria bacterium]|nr:MAG: LamG domain-containing protein [Deltaproteobacteria bacterium]